MQDNGSTWFISKVKIRLKVAHKHTIKLSKFMPKFNTVPDCCENLENISANGL